MIILHHDIFFFWLCVFLFTFIFIYLMESSGQKRGRISSVVEASSSASATPGDDDPRKKWDIKTPMEKMDFGRSHPQAAPHPTQKYPPFRC